MRSQVRLAAILFIGLCLGFAAARYSMAAPTIDAERAAAHWERAAVPARPIVISGAAGLDQQALRDVVRDTIREELKHGQDSGSRALEPKPQPTGANLAAHDKGTDLLGSARSHGRWSEADVNALRQLMPQMTPEQRDEVARAVLVALNNDELKVDFRGMPF